jgi:hypothetical protein
MRKLKYVKLFEGFDVSDDKLTSKENYKVVKKDTLVRELEKKQLSTKIFIKKDTWFELGKGMLIIIISDTPDKYNEFEKEKFKEVKIDNVIDYLKSSKRNEFQIDSETYQENGITKGVYKLK